MARHTVLLVLLCVLVALGGPAPAGHAAPGSLPSVDAGARPGPAVLYEPEPDTPQLQNRDPRFRAATLRVSGQEAYVDGEYLYTDHLYDDYGSDAQGDGGGSLDERAGTLEYPTDHARYGGNAADLVELRIAPGADEFAYRFTLNTLLAADSTMVVIALDTDRNPATGAATLPRDPGAPFPGTDEVIATWGTGAEHSTLAAGADPVTTQLAVSTDLEANQITVTVPRAVSDPRGVWRATVALGLHDPATGGWLRPSGASPTATQPGGAGPVDPEPSGIFNVGFRFSEPYLGANVPPDSAQAEALRAKDPTRFAHDLDFAALDAREDRTSVPATGTQVRFFPSRLDLGEGRDLSAFPQYRGRLQPYSLYVPTSYRPEAPAPFTLVLHSLGQEHWQYNGSIGVQQMGEERGSVVATSLSRGPDGWYQGVAEYDVFEMWSDVARHLRLDSDRTAINGYSMGGYATYRLATRYPDLFGRAYTIVGPPGDGIWVPPNPPTGGAHTNSNLWLENARNVPFLNVAAGADELVPVVGPTSQNLGNPAAGVRGFEQLGYRYRYRLYPTAEHFTIALLRYDVPGAAEFLGDARVERDPRHVTFAAVPHADDADLGLVADHAYWVSQVRVADPGTPDAPGKGVVDAISAGFGRGAPPSEQNQDGGVGPAALAYTEVGRSWGEEPAAERANRLDVALTNVTSASVAVTRAALDPAAELLVAATADRDVTLRLDGAFPAGARVLLDGQELAGVRPDAGGIALPVPEGEHELRVVTAKQAGGRPDVEAAPAAAGPSTGDGPPPSPTPSSALPATGGSVAAGLGLAALGLALGGVPRGRRYTRRRADPPAPTEEVQ